MEIKILEVRNIVEVDVRCWQADDPKTAPIPCIFDDNDEAVAIAYFPDGCRCYPNKIQARCAQHMSFIYSKISGFQQTTKTRG